MLSFLVDNAGTIVISLLVLALITGVIISLIKNKKRGGDVFGCDGCVDCPMHGSCHKAH